MYSINSSTDKPDIQYMLDKVTELVSNRGILVKNITSLIESTNKQYNELQNELYELTGIKNPRSSDQVKQYFGLLKDKDTIENCIDDETGAINTDAQALSNLIELGRQDAILITQCRKINSRLNSYKNITSFVGRDRRIRPTVSLLLSNRINYTEPALMGIPKSELWNIIQTSEGKSLYSVDIKNQEPQIIAYYLDVPEIKEILAEEKGLYEGLFERIYPNETITPVKRSELKTIWNALTYGGSVRMLGKKAKHIDAKAIQKYFNSLSGMKKHKKNCNSIVRAGGDTIKTYFGTTVKSDKAGNQLTRSLMDLAIQGTGADILALLIKHFYEWKSQTRDSLFDIYYTRHDELILEVDNSLPEPEVCNILTELFTHKVDNWKEFNIKITKVSTN